MCWEHKCSFYRKPGSSMLPSRIISYLENLLTLINMWLSFWRVLWKRFAQMVVGCCVAYSHSLPACSTIPTSFSIHPLCSYPPYIVLILSLHTFSVHPHTNHILLHTVGSSDATCRRLDGSRGKWCHVEWRAESKSGIGSGSLPGGWSLIWVNNEVLCNFD